MCLRKTLNALEEAGARPGPEDRVVAPPRDAQKYAGSDAQMPMTFSGGGYEAIEEERAPFPTGSRVKHEEYGEGVVTHAGTKNTNVAVKFDKITGNGKRNRQVSRGSLRKAKK